MSKPKRFVVVSDNHGHHVDSRSADAFFAFVGDYKPEIRVHAGDNWDFANLRKGASDEEKAESLQDDWAAGEAFLRRFFKGGSECHFLRGNHDERIFKLRDSCTGIMRDYAEEGCQRIDRLCRSLGAKMLPYDADLGVFHLGKLRVVHGFHAGLNACALHARAYGRCLFGHVHTQETHISANYDGSEAHSIGCLCQRDLDYMASKTGKLRWAQGWAYGHLFDDGTYQLFTARKIGGKFYAAQAIKSY